MRVLLLNELEPEIRSLFRGFVPIEFRNLLEEGESLMLATVEIVDGELDPAGITLVVIEDDSFVVKWMWTEPRYREREGASMMMDAVYRIAWENGLEEIKVQVPSLDNQPAAKSEMAQFFFQFEFYFVEIKTIDKMRVFELNAKVTDYLNVENEEANEEVRLAKIANGYSKFPKDFKVVDVEYFSGVDTGEANE